MQNVQKRACQDRIVLKDRLKAKKEKNRDGQREREQASEREAMGTGEIHVE